MGVGRGLLGFVIGDLVVWGILGWFGGLWGRPVYSRCFELLISCLRVELFPEAAVVAVQPSIAVPPLVAHLWSELFCLTCILSRILFYSISAQQDPST